MRRRWRMKQRRNFRSPAALRAGFYTCMQTANAARWEVAAPRPVGEPYPRAVILSVSEGSSLTCFLLTEKRIGGIRILLLGRDSLIMPGNSIRRGLTCASPPGSLFCAPARAPRIDFLKQVCYSTFGSRYQRGGRSVLGTRRLQDVGFYS